ncbi:SoxR reducing system RseC family protein [Catenovulum sediminis]|uniref:SoxR reducing system RseC family protein n=1 Tax=Catenovulum sediminis TaxID=1740262 RepID=A0ABV1RJK1_9ALTE|nr:SoxR reducing system RseC family protein [Catenovulum sediminis]
MMYEKAIVVERFDSQHIWVETQIKTTCGKCQHNSECGTGVLAKLLTTRTNKVLVSCSHAVEAGQVVTLAVAENNLVFGSFVLYGIPTLSLLLSMLLFTLVFDAELLVLLFSLLATLASFQLVKYFQSQRPSNQITAVVVEEVDVQTFNCKY